MATFLSSMQRARHLALAGVALSISAAALAAPVAARYADSEYSYSFAPPAGWKRDTQLPRPFVAFVGPEDHSFKPNFSVNVLQQQVEPKDVGKVMKDIRTQVAHIKHATAYAQKHTTLNGKPADSWRLHLRLPGQPVCENRQVACVYHKHLYELTFTVPAVTAKKYEALGDKLFASFKFEK